MSHNKTKAAAADAARMGIQQQQQQQVAINPIALPKKIDDYSAIADFLAGCRSPFYCQRLRTSLNTIKIRSFSIMS
jgi:hypothetical protein